MKNRCVSLLLGAFCFCSFFTSAMGAEPETFGIVAPYVGRLSSAYTNSNYRLNLDESGTMTGAYGQWIYPKFFQANAFFYYAPKVDTTNVYGGHLNADYYPVTFSWAKLVTGIDLEMIKIHTEGAVPGLESLDLHNTVATVMPRLGVEIPVFTEENAVLNILPYAGLTYENVAGDVTLDPKGPTPKMTFPIAESATYASLGLNATLRLFHMLELTGKYMAGLKSPQRMDAFSAMLNVYLSRSMAVSYRFKKMDLPSGSNQYHLLGLALVI